MGRPLRAIPDLDVVVHTGDDDVPPQSCVAREVRRNENPTLLVELGDRGAGKHEALHLPGLPREGVELGDPRDARVPGCPWVDVQVAVDPANEDDVTTQPVAESSRAA